MFPAQPRVQILHKDGKITDARTGKRDRRAELRQFAHLLDNDYGTIVPIVPALRPELADSLRLLPNESSGEASKLYNRNAASNNIRNPGEHLVKICIGMIGGVLLSLMLPNSINGFVAATINIGIIAWAMLWIKITKERFHESLLIVGPRLDEFLSDKFIPPDFKPPKTIDVTQKL